MNLFPFASGLIKYHLLVSVISCQWVQTPCPLPQWHHLDQILVESWDTWSSWVLPFLCRFELCQRAGFPGRDGAGRDACALAAQLCVSLAMALAAWCGDGLWALQALLRRFPNSVALNTAGTPPGTRPLAKTAGAKAKAQPVDEGRGTKIGRTDYGYRSGPSAVWLHPPGRHAAVPQPQHKQGAKQRAG